MLCLWTWESFKVRYYSTTNQQHKKCVRLTNKALRLRKKLDKNWLRGVLWIVKSMNLSVCLFVCLSSVFKVFHSSVWGWLKENYCSSSGWDYNIMTYYILVVSLSYFISFLSLFLLSFLMFLFCFSIFLFNSLLLSLLFHLILLCIIASNHCVTLHHIPLHQIPVQNLKY